MSDLLIVDTTVWCNFAAARQPRLVLEVFPRSSSPRPVLEEIEEGRRRGYFPDFDPSWIPEVEMTSQEVDQAHQLAEKLGRGEAACLAVADSRKVGLLTDDRPARDRAQVLGVTLSGTLGVLLRLVNAGRLSAEEADELLIRMIQARFRSPVTSLTELL